MTARSGSIFCLLWLALLSRAAFAFVYYPVGDLPLRWNVNSPLAHTNVVNPVTKTVRYFIASDAYSAANREAEINAVRACFDQWQSVPGSNLRFEFAGLAEPGTEIRRDNTNVVYWSRKSVDPNLNGARAWTWVEAAGDGSIMEADIVLNGARYQWFTDFSDSVSQGQFIEAVLLHEIGHFVGLDHTVAGGATVFTGGSGVSTEAGLSADEQAAMRFLYPASAVALGAVRGVVRMNGVPILGAVVAADDAAGNLASTTVTRSNGEYDLPALPAGTYHLRVSPLDPANAGTERLTRGIDVAGEYADAVTGFLPTTNSPVTLAPGQTVTRDFAVVAGEPMRITSVSKPTTIHGLVSVMRFGVVLQPGQAGLQIGVSSATLRPDSVLSVTGDGITVGPSTFLPDRIVPGLHSVVATIFVNSNATPGLRTFVVQHGNDYAYANGYLEIAAPLVDYNFDAFDDLFQRAHWSLWTAPEAAPGADPDGDRFSNAFEYRTGTDPTNGASHRLAISSVARNENGTTIQWEADLGRRYQLYGRTALDAGEWQPISRALSAQAPTVSITDPEASATKFYRLELVP